MNRSVLAFTSTPLVGSSNIRTLALPAQPFADRHFLLVTAGKPAQEVIGRAGGTNPDPGVHLFRPAPRWRWPDSSAAAADREFMRSVLRCPLCVALPAPAPAAQRGICRVARPPRLAVQLPARQAAFGRQTALCTVQFSAPAGAGDTNFAFAQTQPEISCSSPSSCRPCQPVTQNLCRAAALRREDIAQLMAEHLLDDLLAAPDRSSDCFQSACRRAYRQGVAIAFSS